MDLETTRTVQSVLDQSMVRIDFVENYVGVGLVGCCERDYLE